MRTVRVPTLCAVIAAAAALVSVPALAATKKVGVRKAGNDYHFTPSSVSISKGDTVRWSWKGKVPHNVKGPGFQSRTATKLKYSRRFAKTGSYRVVCTIHANQGQTMTVRVR